METIHYDDVKRIKSSVCWDEAEDQNSIRDRVKEWYQVFVETKQKIKIQSETRWKNDIKCSLRRSRRSKFNLGQGEIMISSVRWDEAEDQNSIWDMMKEWYQVFVEMKQKIKIQSRTGRKKEIKCSLRRSRRSKFEFVVINLFLCSVSCESKN